MKKCQFWKMPSLKGKSKCQRDRYFTHSLLPSGRNTERRENNIFSQLKWTAITRHQAYKAEHSHSHRLKRSRGARSLWATLLRESQREAQLKHMVGFMCKAEIKTVTIYIYVTKYDSFSIKNRSGTICRCIMLINKILIYQNYYNWSLFF